MRARGADRAVADVVALDAGAQEERALDVALAGRLGLVEHLDDVLEAAGGRVARPSAARRSRTSSFTRRASERYTRSSSSRSAVTLSVSAASMAASWPRTTRTGPVASAQGGGQLADVLGGQPEQLLGLGQGVPAADPQLARAGQPELAVLPVGARQQVDRRLVARRRSGSRTRTPSSVWSPVRYAYSVDGAEGVLGVVRAGLQVARGDHQTLAREALGERGAAGGGVAGLGDRLAGRAARCRPSRTSCSRPARRTRPGTGRSSAA